MNTAHKTIPTGWQRVKLGDISDITNGKTNSQDATTGGAYPLFDRSVAVKGSDKYLFDGTAIILPGEGADFVPRYYSGKFDLHQRAYAIFPNSSAYPPYLFQYLYANRGILVQNAVGSTVKSLRLPIIQGVDILLPLLVEQKKIAEILGAVDGEIQKTDEIIAATEKLKMGLTQQLFTRGIGHTEFLNTRLGTMPQKWQLRKFEELVKFTTGKLNSNASVIDGEYPFFTCSQETFRTNTYAFDQQAILLAGNNAAGKYSVKYYSGKFDAYQRTYVITSKDEDMLDYRYFKEVLQDKLEELKNSSFGSSTKFLTLNLLESLEMKLPPIIEQKKIAGILSAVDEKVSINQKLKAKLTLLKKGLMQDLLSGKVRVSHWWYTRCLDVPEFKKYYFDIYEQNKDLLDTDFISQAQVDPFSMFYELYILKNLQEAGFPLEKRNKEGGPDYVSDNAVFECTVPAIAKDYVNEKSEIVTIEDPITGQAVSHELAVRVDDDIKKLRFSNPINKKIKQYNNHKDSGGKPFVLCICGSKLAAGEKEDGTVVKSNEQFSLSYQNFGTVLDPIAQLLFGFEERLEISMSRTKLIYPEKRTIRKGEKVLDDIHGIFRRLEFVDVSALLFTPYDGVRMNSEKLKSFLYINPNATRKINQEEISRLETFCQIINI